MADLIKVTVNLTARSDAALQRLADTMGCTKTDAVNRALQAFDHIQQVEAGGGRIYTRERDADELERLRFL
jgi:hypothetical protein